jgi:ClpP class serine protease
MTIPLAEIDHLEQDTVDLKLDKHAVGELPSIPVRRVVWQDPQRLRKELTMSLTNLFWLFLIIVSLQPMVKQRLLEMARLQTLQRLERKRKSRVIALIHRQETMSILGIPIARYIDIADSEELLRAIKLTDPDVPIDLIMHTPGGLVLAAEQIAFALVGRKAPTTVLVPHYAMSGGTLIALAANQIVMDENAVLGPVDPQLGEYPAVSILKAVAL